MARTLVIQLARLGDVIQTTPLFQALIEEEGDAGVDALVLEAHKAVLRGLRLEKVRTLKDSALPLSMPQLNDLVLQHRSSFEGLTEAQQVLRQLDLPVYDRVINCTYSALASWLAPRMTRHEVAGAAILGKEWLYRHDAHIYLAARYFFRNENWFNLVDLWRASARVARRPVTGARPHAATDADLPFSLPIGRIIALNPGSHGSQRRWGAAEFAALAESLYGQGFVPILVGAPSDTEICTAVQRVSRAPIASFCGLTTVPQMARLLAVSGTLVSNDTGAVHIASTTGCRVIGLFGATAYFSETAPWSDGHILFQTPLGTNGVNVPPHLVLAAVLASVGRLDESELRRSLREERVPAWKTYFLGEQSDALGGLAYKALHAEELDTEQVFTQALRHIFADHLCLGVNGRSEERPAPVATILPHSELGPRIVLFTRILRDLARAATKCRELSIHPQRESASEVSRTTGQLVRGLERLKELAEEHAFVKPVIHFLDWKCRMMLPQAPDATFAAHQREYTIAAEILEQALLRTEGENVGPIAERTAQSIAERV